MNRKILLALLMAFGVLGGTILSKLFEGDGWWALSGPGLLAAAILAGGFVAWSPGAPGRQLLTFSIAAVSVLGAGAIIVGTNAGDASTIMPILGAGTAPLFFRSGCCKKSCEPGAVKS